ncbi:hypothetical protein JCM8097_007343 [Rhodosporidiobolus ruineniae]
MSHGYGYPSSSPYGQQGYGNLAGDGGFPQHISTQNPFASTSQVDLHGQYPPVSGGGAGGRDSTWSLDEQPYKAVGSGGGAGMARGTDNPYSANYKEPGRWKRWVFSIGLGVLVIAGIAIGIAVWKVKQNDSNSSGSSSSGSSSGKLQYINGTAKVVKSNPNDPSDFERDDRLKPIFWGLAYTPKNVLEEYGCGATIQNITEDVQLVSQLTTRLRTYSTSCNQTQMLLQAIQDTKANMTIWIGAYMGTNDTVNAQQQQDILDALKAYGADHVSGVTIGNEYILNAPNRDETTATAVTTIKTQITDFKTNLAALNLGKDIPVGTADAGSIYTTSSGLATGIDFYFANVHPWFGGVNINDAAGWTWEYFEENDVATSDAAANKPDTYIAETGWPTDSLTAENLTYEGAVAGVSELQTFLDTYPCQANKNESKYFYFEPFDEPWKAIYGGVEPYWGLFDSNKILKNITFPDCEVDSASSSG